MKKIAIAAVISAVFSAPALAADQGFYAGVTVGNGSPNFTAPAGTAFTKTSKITAGGLVGYQINKNFAVEGAYTGIGQENTATGNVSGNALSLTGVGILPLSDVLSAYGKLGLANTKTSSSVAGIGNASRTAVTYGLGLQYKAAENIGVRLGWDRYGSATVDTATALKHNANANVFTAGVVVQF